MIGKMVFTWQSVSGGKVTYSNVVLSMNLLKYSLSSNSSYLHVHLGSIYILHIMLSMETIDFECSAINDIFPYYLYDTTR